MHAFGSLRNLIYLCTKINNMTPSPNDLSTPKVIAVFDAIYMERKFQAVADPDNAVMIDLQMGSTLAAIQLNLNKALQSWYSDSAPYQNTMHLLRKIGALCVQAGEKWGMPYRVLPTATYAETTKESYQGVQRIEEDGKFIEEAPKVYGSSDNVKLN